ncbi:YidH family protein [Bogoriella caseilytica]|uniref:Putative membrane protein n=1 Tax=Bogoriella caseilytica TaxID=56055 RepID=A0A3N2BEJ2_9MICO|nr:DUF202 domain-containing protein [Bogoriella caseilytica]ROR73676.1 putative membrane protein [Bogoriella caseilytica]
MADRRFPRSVYRVGEEPDPRFTLANERTFLAWIRTTMALLAGAVALEALGVPEHPLLRHGAAIVLIAAAVLVIAQAWWGWVRTERAIRQRSPLPSPFSALPLILALVAVAVLIGGGLALGEY